MTAAKSTEPDRGLKVPAVRRRGIPGGHEGLRGQTSPAPHAEMPGQRRGLCQHRGNARRCHRVRWPSQHAGDGGPDGWVPWAAGRQETKQRAAEGFPQGTKSAVAPGGARGAHAQRMDSVVNMGPQAKVETNQAMHRPGKRAETGVMSLVMRPHRVRQEPRRGASSCADDGRGPRARATEPLLRP